MTLTPRQLDVLRSFAALQAGTKLSPTMQELSDDMCLSKVTVFEHMNELERKGYVTRERHKARSIELTAAGRAVIGNPVADRLARFIGENVLEDEHRRELSAILELVGGAK